MVINVIDIVPGADTGNQGHSLYLILRRLLREQTEVVVSFNGIETATSSFVNNAFVSLLDDLQMSDIKSRLKIVQSRRQINDMIRSRLQGAIQKTGP